MTLIRVYFQSALAAQVGISNLAALPDMMAYKRSLHIATVNNKLGVGEKKACQKMMQDLYGISDTFFKEIDQSIKKNCKTQNDIPTYMYLFQGYTQDLMMLVGNQWTNEYIYNIITLAKREPKPSQAELDKAESKLKK